MSRVSHFPRLLPVLILVLGTSASPANAGVLSFDEKTGGTAANFGQSVGWEFNVLSPISVVDLEWYDPTRNGLSTAHMVGIWDPLGVLLTSALIPAGASAGLDGMFRFVSVAPVNLAVGNGYIVGGENSAFNTDRLACGAFNCFGSLSQTVDPAIAYVRPTFSNAGTGFQRPANLSDADQGFYGPSFSISNVPEPSSMTMLAIGFATLTLWRVQRTRQRA